MDKVIIIGCPGSGKSTFAKKLSTITGLKLYHLDMLYWNEDRTTVTREVFDQRLYKVMAEPLWIIDGNYLRTMEMRLEKCDTVFFLDYPTDVCLSGIEERKGKKRSDIPWIENENTDEEFVSFVSDFNVKTRPEVLKLLEKYSFKNIVIFHTREESENYIVVLRKQMKKLNEI